MNKLFKFNSEMTVYILDIWGEEIANNNGTTIKNITLYKKMGIMFNKKFNLNILYNKIEKKVLYEKAKYNAVSNMIYNVI